MSVCLRPARRLFRSLGPVAMKWRDSASAALQRLSIHHVCLFGDGVQIFITIWRCSAFIVWTGWTHATALVSTINIVHVLLLLIISTWPLPLSLLMPVVVCRWWAENADYESRAWEGWVRATSENNRVGQTEGRTWYNETEQWGVHWEILHKPSPWYYFVI